jgi:hypothetical protein
LVRVKRLMEVCPTAGRVLWTTQLCRNHKCVGKVAQANVQRPQRGG